MSHIVYGLYMHFASVANQHALPLCKTNLFPHIALGILQLYLPKVKYFQRERL